ncbi:MAG: pyruvate kinase, partial [Parasporobacterium sp.]|nr:pyruvate kinase [Parasporobacterium sp.]
YHQLALSWGVFPVMAYVQTEPDTLFSHAVDCAVKTGLVHSGDCVVITAGIPLNISGMTNVLTVEYVD